MFEKRQRPSKSSGATSIATGLSLITLVSQRPPSSTDSLPPSTSGDGVGCTDEVTDFEMSDDDSCSTCSSITNYDTDQVTC